MSRAAAVAASLILAGSAAWQAPANGRLADSIGPLPAVVISFVVSVGVLALAAVILAGPARTARIPSELRRVPLRFLGGGLIGPSYVIVAILTVSKLGTGGVIAASVAGTLVGAVGIDWAGALGIERVVPGAARIAGVLLLLLGTVLIAGGGSRGVAIAEMLAMFTAGVLVAFQPPLNARLAGYVGGPGAALAQSTVGLAVVVVITACSLLAGLGVATDGSGGTVPWWAFIGGLFGALYVISTLEAVPVIGAGGVAAASIAGGLAFGVICDAIGLFGVEAVGLDGSIVAGLSLLAAGAALVLRRHQPVP